MKTLPQLHTHKNKVHAKDTTRDQNLLDISTIRQMSPRHNKNV